MYDDLYLAHHGVKGQKWGVRRYQNDDGSLTDAGRKHYGYGDGRRTSSIEVVSESRKKSSGYSEEEPKEEKKKFKLTNKQKRNIAIGIGIAGACLAAYGFYKYKKVNDVSDNPLFDPETGLLKKATNGNSSDNMIDDIKAVNPNLDNLDSSLKRSLYGNNCAKCSAAYEMRRRGFDVEAGRRNNNVQTTDEVMKYFINAERKYADVSEIDLDAQGVGPIVRRSLRSNSAIFGNDSMYSITSDNKLKINPFHDTNGIISGDKWFQLEHDSKYLRENYPSIYKTVKDQAAKDLQKTCSDFGPNARGSISIMFDGPMEVCHSIAFENDKNGNTNFIDSQIAQLVETGHVPSYTYSNFQDYLKDSNTSLNPFMSPKVTRTDNAEANLNYLKENEIIKNTGTEKASLSAYGKQAVGKALGTAGFVSAGYFGIKAKKESEKENAK